MLLRDKVAVVTGGASPRGIGYANAKLFAEHGARVAILDLDDVGAAESASSLGESHRGYGCDVTRWDEVERVFAQVASDLGAPTVLLNNAGITQPKRLLEIDDTDYDAVMNVSLRGSFLCSKAVVPHMQRAGGGSIVSISSVSAKRGGGIFGGPHYSAAKAGIQGLTRALARDLAADNIRVNAVAPGFIQTDINAGKLSPERLEDVKGSIPMGRLGQPIDVARTVLFFASELSDYVTGEIMDVNGGMHID